VSELPPYPPPPPDPPSPDQGPAGDQPTPAPAPPTVPVQASPEPPAATYPPAPRYVNATPAYTYPPAPGQRHVSRNLWVVVASVVVVVVLLIGVIAYVSAGYVYASSRISDASGAINGASAHRAYVSTTFDLLDQQVSSFSAMTDPKLSKSTAGELVSESQNMSAIVGGDDQAMVAARSRLHDQQWLTAISSARLDAEAGRIDHARKALGTLKSAAADYRLLGQFFQAFYQALIDFDTLLTADKNADFVGESSADTAMQADVAKAQQLTATTPGLPSEYHDFLVALLAFAVDAAKVLNAHTQAASDAANKSVTADFAAMSAVDFTGTSAKIKSYYQHYRDDFNAEMDKATT
jgi:hypothetical protein